MGWPGAGKSYFAKHLAAELKAVRLNSDSMRNTMFVEPKQSLNPEGYSVLFGAMDYAAAEVLKAGYDVIYDAKCNRRSEREKNAQIALENGAAHITIWVKTPKDASLERASSRENALDQGKFTDEQVKLHEAKSIEEPNGDEPHITIAGHIPFEQQYKSFTEQLVAISSESIN